MKTLLILLLVQHAVISARSGLITYVGSMVEQVDNHMGEGNEIRSRRGSRFEAMLGPNTYVRIQNRAAIILESESLDSTALRLVQGAAIVEAKQIYDDVPIRILVKDLEFSIWEDGLFLFEENRITVLDGELRIEDSADLLTNSRLRKNQQLIQLENNGTFREERLEDTTQIERLPLVRWSRQRSEQLTPEPVFRRGRGQGTRRFRF